MATELDNTNNVHHNNDSSHALENGTSQPYQRSASSSNDNETVAWIIKFNKFDEILSGGSLHLPYRIVDIVILLIGLLSTMTTCGLSNHLSITSMCLLVFYLIDLIIVGFFVLQNISPSYTTLTAEERTERQRRAGALRGIFIILKIIPICFGMGYAFTSTIHDKNDCEIMRFCLGTVCISTLFIAILPPTKPELPPRRSFLIEFSVLLFFLIINGVYAGTVLMYTTDNNEPACKYKNIEDLYFEAPLQSYAYFGVILFSSSVGANILHLIFSQLSARVANGRQLYKYYYAFQYLLNYLGAILILYYLSVGSLLLFQPRSGGTCGEKQPGLYKVLLVWQWIRILAPLFLLPLLMVLCCLGVFVGVVLTYCLPASITVPLIDLIRVRFAGAPVTIHPNPPATQENIDAIPEALFGEEPDQFNQTECAICRTNFELNEKVKKLTCGHIFHGTCVANWLLITRICPLCRQRMA